MIPSSFEEQRERKGSNLRNRVQALRNVTDSPFSLYPGVPEYTRLHMQLQNRCFNIQGIVVIEVSLRIKTQLSSFGDG